MLFRTSLLNVRIKDGIGLKKLGFRLRTDVMKVALQETAVYWHDMVFPGHFAAGARREYQFEKRNRGYIFQTKIPEGVGPGKSRPDLFHSFSELRMKHMWTVRGTANKATVSMDAPAYFTNPALGTFTNPRTGRTFHISHQPDKPKEVTQVSQEDREELSTFYREAVLRRVKALTGREARGQVTFS